MSGVIIKKLYIDKFKGFKNFSVEFDDELTLFVGANGTGKTTILEIIYNSLLGNSEYFKKDKEFTKIVVQIEEDSELKEVTIVSEGGEIKKYIDNKEITENDSLFSKQLALYIPSEVNFQHFDMIGPNKMEGIDKSVVLNSDDMSKKLRQFLINEKYKDLNDIAQGKMELANRIETFKNLYNNFFKDKEFIGIDDDSFEILFKIKDSNEIITIDELSSGEKQIFFKGGSLIQYTKNKSLIILIDEPEISMHPEWQQEILSFYRNINRNSQFIFATHSSHIVSCCRKEQLRVIEKQDERLVIKTDIAETYGATDEKLLLNIFDLKSVRNPKVQEDINEYIDLFYRKQLLSEDELNKMESLREEILQNHNLSESELSLLEFESKTNRFEEMLKKLGDGNA